MKFMIVAAMLVAACAAQQPRDAVILKLENDITPEGNYRWSYETDNGIQAQAQGDLKQAGQGEVVQVAQGGFAYTSPDGTPIQVSYVADENGFQPQGAHLPVPPPIPEAILKSIEYNARNPPHPDYTQ